MFFVWTNDGGPLQYIGLGLFVLQVVPQLFPELLQTFHTTTSVIQQPSSLSCWAAMGILAGVLAMAIWRASSLSQGGGNDNGNDNSTSTRLRLAVAQWRHQTRLRLRELTGMEWTNFGISCLVGVATGCLATVYMTTRSTWIPYLYQLVTFASIFYTVVRQGGRGGGEQQQQRRQERRRQAKLDEMAALVRRMPLEPFVAEEETPSCYSGVPIAQLKQMLQIRGATQAELNSFVDRQNMVESLKRRRQYSDTCCICFEPYQEGEPLRVLPKCCHELHVECLDKWVYTFATNAAKLRQDPTCPLCKEGLK